MTDVNEYRIWCSTEGDFVYDWAETEPTTCPNDTAHSIDSSKTTIHRTLGGEQVQISDFTDGENRPYVRAESRDVHDTTYFTTRGDGWEVESGEVIGTGDGGTKLFKLSRPEVRGVVVLLDGVPQVENTDYTVDYSTYDDQYNAITHYCTGTVTFVAAPAAGVVVAAGYAYAVIGCDHCSLTYDFGKDSSNSSSSSSYSSQTSDSSENSEGNHDEHIVNLTFCDPVHIKDGFIAFMNGEIDSTGNVYVVCPAGYPYQDNAGNTHTAEVDTIIEHYVNDIRLMGDVPQGQYFDVETRSDPVPPGYIIRVVINRGSSTTLKGYTRLEINRERTMINIPMKPIPNNSSSSSSSSSSQGSSASSISSSSTSTS
jgi:hypothetical protein